MFAEALPSGIGSAGRGAVDEDYGGLIAHRVDAEDDGEDDYKWAMGDTKDALSRSSSYQSQVSTKLQSLIPFRSFKLLCIYPTYIQYTLLLINLELLGKRA